jgi:fatty-acyl-CoA synthase
MIIRGGENIYPVEIEAVLTEHPDVEIASVVGVEDAHWGQTVRAWIILRPEAGDVSPQELRDFCAANLARYKLPNELYFAEELPRNASGKILKRELVHWDPAEKAVGGGAI